MLHATPKPTRIVAGTNVEVSAMRCSIADRNATMFASRSSSAPRLAAALSDGGMGDGQGDVGCCVADACTASPPVKYATVSLQTRAANNAPAAEIRAVSVMATHMLNAACALLIDIAATWAPTLAAVVRGTATVCATVSTAARVGSAIESANLVKRRVSM